MQQWLDRNFRSVTAMYEDRHELWGFDHRGRLFLRMLPARRAQVAIQWFCKTCSSVLIPLVCCVAVVPQVLEG